MEIKFQMTKIAMSIGLVVGSGLFAPATVFANSCNSYSDAGTCGLIENRMGDGKPSDPTAWYFTSPSQDAAINANANRQNIYFGGAGATRSATDVQSLLVDGAKLDGFYINASKIGSANITLVNNASVDWLESGDEGKTTNNTIVVDNSRLNGAQAIDYSQDGKKPLSKSYARGFAIFLDAGDSGDQKIDIRNHSEVKGSIWTGGTGSHDITIEDSQVKPGKIYIYSNATGDNTVTIKNSIIDVTDALAASTNAIEIGSGENIQLNVSGSQITGDTSLTGTPSGTITTKINNNSTLTGDLNLNQAAQTALAITQSTLTGSINASASTGNVDIKLTNSLIGGDINLSNGNALSTGVLLDNTSVGGHIYGRDNSTLTLASSMASFDGAKFSGFNTLNVSGQTNLTGGFTDDNVGNALQVNGGELVAPVQLSVGKLTFSGSKVIADTLALSDAASLELNSQSLLQTSSSQLFNSETDTDSPTGLNETASRMTFSDSTLALTDETYQLSYVKALHDMLDTTRNNKLLMMGTLLDGEQASGTASVVDVAATGAVLANVQIVADKNSLFIGTKASDENAITVDNGFGAAQLHFTGEGNPSVVIGNGQALTLTGALGGSLIDVAGAPDAVANITVADKGALNLGTRATGDTTSTLRGIVNVAGDGQMHVIAGDHTITSGGSAAGVISSGELTIHDSATLHSDVALQNQGQLTVNGTLDANNLTASEAAQIFVGNDDTAGALIANSVDLQGARMFIDPDWSSTPTIDQASKVVLGGNEVNGRLTAGRNSLLVLGDTSADAALNAFSASGLNWASDGVTAALAISAPQYLSATGGGLRIDGSLTSSSADRDATANQAEFGSNSLLMVNAAETTGNNAALNATGGTLKVADSAALYVADAKANNTYTIAQGFTDVQREANGWQGSNLILNKLLDASTQENNGSVTVTTTAKDAQKILPGVATANALNSMINSAANSLTSPYAGIRFLSQAIESPEAQISQVVNAINSAAQMAVAGGVQNSTLATGMAAVDAILDRNSAANHAMQKDDKDASVWVHALYGNQRSRDFTAGNMDYGYNSNFYGIMLGGDKAYDTSAGVMRSGAAFHAGNGKTNSTGDVNSTHNDFTFWGVSLYQNWSRDGFNVTADAGFSASNNDLNQNLPGWMNFGDKLKGSVDSQLLTVGVTGEYLISTPVMDIIPHVGARYNQLTTKAFDTKTDSNETLFKTEKERQNIWQFPAGVKLNKTFALDSGWALSTQADVAVITSTGDTNINSKVRTTGISATDTIFADNVVDKTSFNGQLGVKLQKGASTWGVGYNLNASEHNTGQTVIATYKLTF